MGAEMFEFDRDEEIAKFCELSKSLGLAATVQRRAVFEALIDARNHPSADKIYEEIVKKYPSVSRTSVYRILDTFSRLGIVRKVDHPGSAAMYDAYLRPHHHAVCVHCGKVIDVPFSPGDRESLERVHSTMKDFEIRDFMVTFQGICSECSAADKPTHHALRTNR